MKYDIKTAIVILFLFIIIPLNPINAAESDPSLINTFEDDITGDGFREYINVKGNFLSTNSLFYQNVWIDIQNNFKKQWSISLQNGYDPQLKLIDLNHDKIFDLFYQVKKESVKDKYSYQIYTLKSGKVTSIPLPERIYAEGKFMDDFKINIRLDPHKGPKTIDIIHKKTAYINNGVYDANGTLRQEKSIQIDPISHLEPILISKSKGYGLKSMQQIKGIDGDDHIGTLETLWHLKDEKWILIKSKLHLEKSQ